MSSDTNQVQFLHDIPIVRLDQKGYIKANNILNQNPDIGNNADAPTAFYRSVNRNQPINFKEKKLNQSQEQNSNYKSSLFFSPSTKSPQKKITSIMKNTNLNEFQLDSVKSQYIDSAQKIKYELEANQDHIDDNSLQILQEVRQFCINGKDIQSAKNDGELMKQQKLNQVLNQKYDKLLQNFEEVSYQLKEAEQRIIQILQNQKTNENQQMQNTRMFEIKNEKLKNQNEKLMESEAKLKQCIIENQQLQSKLNIKTSKWGTLSSLNKATLKKQNQQNLESLRESTQLNQINLLNSKNDAQTIQNQNQEIKSLQSQLNQMMLSNSSIVQLQNENKEFKSQERSLRQKNDFLKNQVDQLEHKIDIQEQQKKEIIQNYEQKIKNRQSELEELSKLDNKKKQSNDQLMMLNNKLQKELDVATQQLIKQNQQNESGLVEQRYIQINSQQKENYERQLENLKQLHQSLEERMKEISQEADHYKMEYYAIIANQKDYSQQSTNKFNLEVLQKTIDQRDQLNTQLVESQKQNKILQKQMQDHEEQLPLISKQLLQLQDEIDSKYNSKSQKRESVFKSNKSGQTMIEQNLELKKQLSQLQIDYEYLIKQQQQPNKITEIVVQPSIFKKEEPSQQKSVEEYKILFQNYNQIKEKFEQFQQQSSRIIHDKQEYIIDMEKKIQELELHIQKIQLSHQVRDQELIDLRIKDKEAQLKSISQIKSSNELLDISALRKIEQDYKDKIKELDLQKPNILKYQEQISQLQKTVDQKSNEILQMIQFQKEREDQFQDYCKGKDKKNIEILSAKDQQINVKMFQKEKDLDKYRQNIESLKQFTHLQSQKIDEQSQQILALHQQIKQQNLDSFQPKYDIKEIQELQDKITKLNILNHYQLKCI